MPAVAFGRIPAQTWKRPVQAPAFLIVAPAEEAGPEPEARYVPRLVLAMYEASLLRGG